MKIDNYSIFCFFDKFCIKMDNTKRKAITMNFEQDMDIILQYAHYWNWLTDWITLQNVYSEFSDIYSILTPFAYSYLEKIIRSTTSEYGIELLDKKGNPRKRKIGKGLISLAK